MTTLSRSCAQSGASRNPPWFLAAYLAAIVAQLALAAGLASAHWDHTGQLPLGGSPDSGRFAAGTDTAMRRITAALLQHRSQAILASDRSAFLATVDPRSSRFITTQARLFQRVIEVPFSRWDHQVRGSVSPSVAQFWLPRLQRRYGAPVWLAEVTIAHRFNAVSDFELTGTHYLTFVLRGGSWYLAADDDLESSGLRSSRQLWDFGPVVAAAGAGTLVLGHLVQQDFVQQVGALTGRARAAVNGRFDVAGTPVVVMVPSDLHETRQLVPSAGGDEGLHLAALSAVTTSGTSTDPHQAYVVINTETMAGLGEAEQSAILRHESAHIATWDAAGINSPTWLSEGIAEYAAYADSGLGPARFAPELAAAVRAGKLPQQLPTRQMFDSDDVPSDAAPSDQDLPTGLAYRYAWSACALLVERVGLTELVELYRRANTTADDNEIGSKAGSVWPSALQDGLSLSLRDFTQLWREYLVTMFDKPLLDQPRATP
ncbi:MAG: hypothetical protein ACRDPW_09140 [Mycobacteriales bacterium]